MTYSSYETSLEAGTPVELYEFVQGIQRWSYISGADSIVRLGQVYTPMPVTRDRIKQSSDIFKDSLKLSFPRDDAFASQFLGFAPEDVTTVTVLRGHVGDPDEQFIVYWKGRVVGAKAAGNKVDVECESVFTSIKRPGLRARFEYGCRHALYLRGCGVNRELYKLEGAVLSIAGGLTVAVAGAALQPAGYYTGGMLVAPSGASRFLVNHTGDQVTMARPLAELVGGMTVAIYPGCDHLKSTCKDKFNNLPNFGGFPYIPTRNPFDGSSIA
ncbi:FAD/FMN-containing dehydrogenase [Pseudomonas phage phiH1]|uniref:FAD/FMN-containing dehydrogenase n=1 Tax=Pseudomonas phage phiH1 TaxID=2982871 RepID=A0AAX3D2N0_9CAUD|nr:FAD/FMN-containing dehydrogenase [Pseudomonas phage phiH1]UYD21608.1 FAD/FMN-containing dehydrogenase [Pseudomonas phage phiH1]